MRICVNEQKYNFKKFKRKRKLLKVVKMTKEHFPNSGLTSPEGAGILDLTYFMVSRRSTG